MPKNLPQILELPNTQHSRRKEGKFTALIVSASIAFIHFGPFKRKKEGKKNKEREGGKEGGKEGRKNGGNEGGREEKREGGREEMREEDRT